MSAKKLKKPDVVNAEEQALATLEETSERVVSVTLKWESVAKLKNDSEQLAADAALSIVKKELAAHEADRKQFVAPLNEVVKRINARYKPLTEQMESLERHLKLLMVGRLNELREIELEKAEKEAKKAEKAGAGELAEDIRASALTKHVGATLEGVSMRKNYSCKVTDLSKVPREYLVPDQVKLNALARALKDGFAIAGCELVVEETITKSVS